MSTAAERVIATARSQLGVTEQPPGSNNGPQPYLKGHAWCGEFVMWAYQAAKVSDDGIGSPSTWQIVQNAKAAGRTRPTPVMGTIVVWNPGKHGHTELFIKWVGVGLAMTIGGNTGDAVREHVRYLGGAFFCVPKALEAPPVYVTTYWWEDPAAKPDRHGLYAAIASREKAIRAWVAEDGDPGHVRRGKLSVMAGGKLVPRYTFWTGPRKRSPDFIVKAKRDRDLEKVAAQRPGHILRPRSSRVRVS